MFKILFKEIFKLHTIDEERYPCYRRRDDGKFVGKNGIKLDNISIVPYSPTLLVRY